MLLSGRKPGGESGGPAWHVCLHMRMSWACASSFSSSSPCCCCCCGKIVKEKKRCLFSTLATTSHGAKPKPMPKPKPKPKPAATKTETYRKSVLGAVALANPHVRIRWQVALLRCCGAALWRRPCQIRQPWRPGWLVRSAGGGASVCVGVTNVKHYSSTVNTS